MHRSWLLLLLSLHIGGQIYLFDTEDSVIVQQYDCIDHTTSTSVKYCRRPVTPIPLSRSDGSCLNGGEHVSFRLLLEQHVPPEVLLQWNISLERVDDYASFFHHESQTNLNRDDYLCRCVKPGTFGKFCEYHWLDDAISFKQSIEEQFEEKERNPWGAQHYGDILCYQAKDCYSGLLCLDWRNICDGEQQCFSGYDEQNCDLLEFNECDDDEFRCTNGMCIPDEYWLDGQADCMDSSDEIIIGQNTDCFYSTDHWRCDESVCHVGLWSCGDGQCIPSWNRFGYQRLILTDDYCLNHRELNHMCEASWRWSLWTRPDTGLCTNKIGYDDPNWSLAQTAFSPFDRCLYLIRCALSRGFERDCVCNHLNCSRMILDQCDPDMPYPFPSQPLVRSYMISEYFSDHNWMDPTPDQYIFHGEILCRGYTAKISMEDGKGLLVAPHWIQLPYVRLDFQFCDRATIKDIFGPQFDSWCWSNHTRTFNQQPYPFDAVFCPSSHRCINYYRARDTTYDCADLSDEDSNMTMEQYCAKIRKHRFSCSRQEPYCIQMPYLISITGLCADGYERYLTGHDGIMHRGRCSSNSAPDCQVLREYISNSSIRNTSRLNDDVQSTLTSTSRIPHHWYCDSLWDEATHSDESSTHCRLWVCTPDQYQCQTGQCIPSSWLCDGEWDCSDASDEETLLSIRRFSGHNQRLEGFSELIGQCYQKYSHQAFSTLCNTSLELPCLRTDVPNPLNITEYRPCLPFDRVGDQHEDCVAGHDEKNTAANCEGTMLGLTYRDEHGICYHPRFVCREVMETPLRKWWCFYQSQNASFCAKEKDVICFNGSCQPDARCDGIFQCTHGEDEYRCPSKPSSDDFTHYRWEKTVQLRHQTQKMSWMEYPGPSMIEHNRSSEVTAKQKNRTEENAFICNRGVAVGSIEGKKVCFCSPAYYGDRCQFYSDHLTVIARLNISESMSHSVYKILAVLSQYETVISHHEFIIDGAFERNNPSKHRFTLLYARIPSLLSRRRSRYLHRQHIIDYQAFSVRFYLFQLDVNETVELGQWIYPIYLDFLPVLRLAKILTIPENYFFNGTASACQNHSCPSVATCLPIFNQPRQVYCACQHEFYGNNCQRHDLVCSSYCSSKSICKFDLRGLVSNTNRPFCVCPLGYYGPRCYLRHNQCQSQPCWNNGTCHLTYDPTGMRPFRCQCSIDFYGDHCQWRKALIQIDFDHTTQSSDLISILQFCDVYGTSLEILVQNQRLIHGLPANVFYNDPSTTVPILGILKMYSGLTHLNYSIVYLMQSPANMHLTSRPKQCPQVMTLLTQMPFDWDDGTPLLFKYHQLCHHFRDLYCFYADDYLCVCDSDHERASCFLHDINIDRCDRCLSGGKCLRGDLKNPKDFFCICPQCYQGERCQFSMEPFGSTIDSLLSSFQSNIQLIYLIVSICLFFIGLINNISSSLTLRRTIPRQTAVGHFLLIMTLLNQLSLFSLLLKFLHNFIGISGWFIPYQLNVGLCKAFSYTLSMSTRSFYWLASWMTIDRFLIVVFPMNRLFQRPFLAKLVSGITILVIGLMHWHEIFFYTMIEQSTSPVCVTHFEDQNIARYNRMTILLHSLAPFTIQIISITLLIFHIARSRARAREATLSLFSRAFLARQFLSFKELYITPSAIAVSCLPQMIVSFTLACQELVSWQKHLLLFTYLISYTPQILAFCLFILPSSVYRKEFHETWIGQRLFSS